jgi:hypothetical protein
LLFFDEIDFSVGTLFLAPSRFAAPTFPQLTMPIPACSVFTSRQNLASQIVEEYKITYKILFYLLLGSAKQEIDHTPTIGKK